MPFPGAVTGSWRGEGNQTKRKARPCGGRGRGAGLEIPPALRESEAAAGQLCSLGCMSGGPGDLKQAHSFCESLGPPQRAEVNEMWKLAARTASWIFGDCTGKARPIAGYPGHAAESRNSSDAGGQTQYLPPFVALFHSMFPQRRGNDRSPTPGTCKSKEEDQCKGGGGANSDLSSHL